MKWFYILAVGCCLLAPTASRAQEKKKIVIESSIGEGIPKSLAESFKAVLTVGLTNSGSFDVITNRDEYLAKLDGELRAQDAGLIDDRQMLELGKAAGADHVAYVRIESFDEQYLITLQITEIETGISKGLIRFDPIVTSRSELLTEARNMAIRLADGGEKTAISKSDVAVSNVLTDGGRRVGGHIDHRDRAAATYSEAVSTCEAKGDGWRLPTIEELETMYRNRVSLGSSSGFQRFGAVIFWSSSVRNGYSVYGLDFSNGTRTFISKTSQSAFRCVRNE